MALIEKHLQKQTERLKTLPRGEDRPWGNDKTPGLRNELFSALWTAASTDEHATEIIDYVMKVAKFAPTPADLYEYANAQAEQAKNERSWQPPQWEMPTDICGRCQSFGSLQNSEGLWIRCACPNGQEYPQNLLDLQNTRLEKVAARGEVRRLSQVDQEDMERTLARAIAARALAGDGK